MLLCNCIIPSNELSFKDYFPLISSAIVIVIFIFDRALGYNIRQKELNRNWYFKVLLEPKLDAIDDFFNDVERHIKKANKDLNKIDFNSAKANYIKCQLTNIDDFKEIKRKFELQVLKPIYSRYSDINTDLNSVVDNIVNEFTEEVDGHLLAKFNFNDFSKKLYENKIILLDLLYKPLNSK
ncbi:hypothetical protein [Pseudomonas shirazensis]